MKAAKFTITAILIALVVFACHNSQAQSYSRLLVCGDSLSRGVHASGVNHSFAALVADELRIPYAQISCQNSVTAQTLLSQYAAYGADLIVIELGLHDVSERTLEEFELEYSRTVDVAMATGARVVVCTMFHSVREERPDYRAYVAFNEAIRQIAAEKGIPLCELWDNTYSRIEYLARTDEVSFTPPFHGDEWHPNDAGHAAIAAEILHALGHGYYMPLLIGD